MTNNKTKIHMLSLNNLSIIRVLLEESSVIAIVGLSPKTTRPSNMVARYLIETGYTVIPVNPGHDRILDLPCYPSISAIPGSIDIVDIFRKSEDVEPIVREAVETDCKAIWMQQGIINHQAARIAENSGKIVIMDRCIKIDHADLIAP
ncbi:MAG: CoA-binding protein [Desulfopila sp.]|nr:CoA-binding protein [Desulfopila sp.]